MNIRFRVYYITQEEKDMPVTSWGATTKCKNVRASNEEKAKEIFKMRHPDLIPVFVSKY